MTSVGVESDAAVTTPELELCWGTVAADTAEQVLRAGAAGGYAAVTLTPYLAHQALESAGNRASIHALTDELGVQVSVIDPLIAALPGLPVGDGIPPQYRSFFAYDTVAVLEIAEAVGARTVNIAHFLGERVEFARLVDAIGSVCAGAAGRGLAIALEFLPDSGIPSLSEALAILQAVAAPNAGLTVDSWHLARSGGTVAQVAALAPGMVRVLQLSDRIAPAPDAPYTIMSDRLLPGTGELDLAGLVRAARANNPALRIGVEVFSEQLRRESAADAAVIAANALRAVLTGPD